MDKTKYKNAKKVLTKFAKDAVRSQKDRMANFNKNDPKHDKNKYSENLSKSFSYEIIESSDGILLEFLANDYSIFVDSGRSPFIGYPSIRLLSPAERPARRKAKLGTKPFMILRQDGDVFTQTKLNKLVMDLEEATAQDLEDEIYSGF